MTPEEETLGRVMEILERLAIPCMLTGSVAASYHGRPRATHDADVVIDPTAQQLERLIEALTAAGYYVDPDQARHAVQRRSQFNAIEKSHACKIDLIIRRDRPFSEEEFSRRQTADLPFGRAVPIVTAEDAVLSKLEWARRSGDSERQLTDASGIVAVNPDLDRAYIERWAAALGVSDLWRRIAEAKKDGKH